MRSEAEFDRALAEIESGVPLRHCSLPHSTLLTRAARDAGFERRLDATRHTGRLRRIADVKNERPIDRAELLSILSARARSGSVSACVALLRELPKETVPIDDPFADVVALARSRPPR
jgi:hypothetical protein